MISVIIFLVNHLIGIMKAHWDLSHLAKVLYREYYYSSVWMFKSIRRHVDIEGKTIEIKTQEWFHLPPQQRARLTSRRHLFEPANR